MGHPSRFLSSRVSVLHYFFLALLIAVLCYIFDLDPRALTSAYHSAGTSRKSFVAHSQRSKVTDYSLPIGDTQAWMMTPLPRQRFAIRIPNTSSSLSGQYSTSGPYVYLHPDTLEHDQSWHETGDVEDTPKQVLRPLSPTLLLPFSGCMAKVQTSLNVRLIPASLLSDATSLPTIRHPSIAPTTGRLRFSDSPLLRASVLDAAAAQESSSIEDWRVDWRPSEFNGVVKETLARGRLLIASSQTCTVLPGMRLLSMHSQGRRYAELIVETVAEAELTALPTFCFLEPPKISDAVTTRSGLGILSIDQR